MSKTWFKNVIKYTVIKNSQMLKSLMHTDIQWKPLNVITLGQTKSDNINQMITITDCFI
jgi:hypothetical protein